MSPFETALVSEMKRIRKLLSSRNIPQLDITISCSGRVDSGDIRISFYIGPYDKQVESGDLEAGIDEYCRRTGWTKRHAAICLPKVEPIKEGE